MKVLAEHQATHEVRTFDLKEFEAIWAGLGYEFITTLRSNQGEQEAGSRCSTL